MPRFSTMTSITQSTSESLSKSSSMLPAEMSEALRGCVSISGFDLAICLIAAFAMALRSPPSLTMSSKSTWQPAFAACAAIPAPITPLPMTATRSMGLDK